MSDFVTLTGTGGAALQVNLDLVEYIEPSGAGATLYFTRLRWFSTDKLAVRESPEEVVGNSSALV